jgi:hypothetical protein
MVLVTTRRTLFPVFIFLLSFASVSAQSSDAKQLGDQLNPLSLAIDPLIDHAASDGNAVAQEQLEHVRAIAHSELDHLKEIEDGAISASNDAARKAILLFFKNVRSSITQIGDILDEERNGLNSNIEARISQLEVLGNVVDGLPMNVDPVVDTKGKNTLFAYKDPGRNTSVYISGVGLKKDGEPPKFMIRSDLDSNPQPIYLKTSSSGLTHIEIPNALVGNSPGDKKLYLDVIFRAGHSTFGKPDYRNQSFDLDVCTPDLTKERVIFSTSAGGSYYAKRDVIHPKMDPAVHDGGHIGIYVANRSLDVCAADANADNWEPDPDSQGYGLSYWEASGSTGTLDKNTPNVGCVRLGANDRQNVIIWDVAVHQRKKYTTLDCDQPPAGVPYARCYCSDAKATQELDVPPGTTAQTHLDADSAKGICNVPGLPAPTLTTIVQDVAKDGKVLGQNVISPGDSAKMEGGKISVSMTPAENIVTVTVRSTCSLSEQSK